MKRYQQGFLASGLARDMGLALIAIMVISLLAGAGLALGLPPLWHWLKPIIHAVTA